MYIDNTITTEFTGYYDSTDEVYVYPSARQNLLLLSVIGADAIAATSTTTEDEEIPEEDDTPTPPSAYLSAMDGDFTTDGATFTHSAGESEDITIGNAISQVMSGTLLNPDGLLDGLAFSKNVKAFIGVETATEAATIPEGASAYVEFAPLGGTVHSHYAIGSVAYADGDLIRDMGEEITSISALPYLAGHIYFWTASGACLYFDETEGYVPPAGGTYTYATDPRWHYVADISTTGWGDFMQGKYANTPQSLLMDGTRKYFVAGSKPTIYTWDIENGTKTTWQYVPMGIFDMSAVSVSGFAYTFEAYDRMILLDADATAWLESFLPTFPESGTIEDFVMALETAAGMPSAYWGSLDTPNYDVYASFIASALYHFHTPFTYRQIVQWVAAFCGTNARINRYGYLEFFQYKTLANLPTITPDVIVSQSREVSRYTIPQITKLVWYDTAGLPIESGTDGSTYTIAGNPLANYVTDSQMAVDNILTRSLANIPAYNAASLTDACADPRVDIGDILTVTRTDGTTYFVPLMQYTLTWRGNCVAEYTATGNQTREALQGATQDAALAQKLADEKVDKAGDTMTGNLVHDYGGTRKSTISDSSHRVENASDPTQNTTQSYNGLVTTDGTDTSSIAPDLIETSGTVKARDTVEVGNDSSNGAVTIQQAQASSADPYNLKFKSTSSRYMAQHGMQYSRMYDSGTSGTAPATNGSVNNTTRNPSGYWASDNTSFSAATKGSAMTRDDGFVAKDGSEVVTHNSNELSWEHATGAPSSMRMYTLRHNSSSTAETTYTIDIPYGTYLFLHSRYTTPVAAAQGAQLVAIGQTANSNPLITLLAGGADLSATSGTRSQVTIGNTDSNQKATVTWTVQGRTYRRLVMVRLM